MELLINVINQKLKLATNLKSLVAGTQQFIKLIFNLPNEWDGLLTFAQFIQGSNSYNAYLDENNSVYLPSEIQAGTCKVLLYGTGNQGENSQIIATTNCLEFTIDENIIISDASSTDISQSLYDQLVQRVNNIIAHNNDTEGNSELIDIRTGNDGTVYNSAGRAVREQISKLENAISQLSDTTSIRWEDGYLGANGNEGVDPARTRTCFIPCTENMVISYKAETDHQNISALTAYDINKRIIAVNVNIGEHNVEYEFITPANTRFVRLSSKKSYETYIHFSESLVFSDIGKNFSDVTQLKSLVSTNTSSIASIRQSLDSNLNAAFVSANGSDSNSGSKSHPYATVNKALQSNAKQIIMTAGIYEQTINLSNAVNKRIHIVNGSNTGRVIFRPSDSLLTSEETLVEGYTKVYSAEVSAVFASANKWIFQDGIADETTLIDDDERMPAQRGYAYRCEDTKIQKCSAQTTEDAITEIENSDSYKWFYDSSNSVLYFSRPQAVTAANPIRASFGASLFSNADRSISLNLTGIETKYMSFNISDTSNSYITDCKSSNVYGEGAFIYNRCIGAAFERCEATRCFYGVNGDGFNAHSYSTGNIHSKQTTVTLIDCWSHDNSDDGYSDHERSETTIIGGLYEYNGKAGITPSYGSHCSCYNVYSRHNNNGFFYIGDATQDEGGKYGQLYCNGCVAAYNTAGGETKSGFIISNTGNSAVLVNCKSIGNRFGYYANLATNGMLLIDCGSVDDINQKFGNITIKNTVSVE